MNIKSIIHTYFPFIEKQWHIHKFHCINTKRYSQKIKHFFINIDTSKRIFNQKKQIKNLILSFTSFPARLPFVEYTLFSIIQQTIRPQKIILWLSIDEFPEKKDSIPENLLRYMPFNVEIQFIEDNLKSYKKLVYALEKYPNDIIVTLDDDIYYKPDWLEKLYDTHINFPNDIIAHRVHEISFKNNQIDLYQNWIEGKIDVSFLNFFTGAGGILYPPRSLYGDAVNSEYFMNLCPSADDIWFYVMALLQKTLIRKVKKGYDKAIDFDYVFDRDYATVPKLTNINLNGNRNDIQFKAVLEHYGIYESFYALYGGDTCY